MPTESEVPDVELSDLSTPGLARMEAAAPVVLVLPQVYQATRPHHGHSIVSGEWSWQATQSARKDWGEGGGWIFMVILCISPPQKYKLLENLCIPVKI